VRGYSISLEPAYNVSLRSLLDLGVVYVVANLPAAARLVSRDIVPGTDEEAERI
jgi:hypothetical protein